MITAFLLKQWNASFEYAGLFCHSHRLYDASDGDAHMPCMRPAERQSRALESQSMCARAYFITKRRSK